MLDIVFRNSTKDKTYGLAFFQKMIKTAIKELGIEGLKFELSLNIIGNQHMYSLNKKFRHKDKPTDVLSFPLQSLDNPISAETKSDGILSLGDIFIALTVAQEKAEEEKKTIEAELAFLTIHGFLHLLGYDHEKSKREEKLTFDLQDKILTKLNIR